MEAKQCFNLPDFNPGNVWLVGAGPGDPGLLTLHSVNAIQQADHILYDALVDPACLRLAKSDCFLEFAGKRGGQPSLKQNEITERMISLAKEGKRVLRLKGGDPFVFGRGGEEAVALAKAGICFRIVPGITAGIAGPAYAGIPVTHRSINQSVTFLTGHDSCGEIPSAFDWQAIAKASPVLVLYMAMKHIHDIADKLIQAGRDAHDPVVFVSNATMKNQEVVETTLKDIAQCVKKHKIFPPAIVIIGEVASMRSLLGWLPLNGNNGEV
ncbi:uroporphyrinogen-III C-methyltransferase [Bartonella tamiae]|uniref:uroporphyrinogen-III C-methyltransferase n=1 Tax=Bartonella tamiae Th239 TaxID=1094558 RepID=J1JVF6_9HYPH|nr:uroporphyrinogen-III C-methyltransferase [Bartonella tamiae]EJF88922.1 uroporphyrinogen-III C-methyltransferase [Bartonella tamiae Th239]EJF94828.1 uroporphyrinogen-III C-methyltransferase [Bartonella tamiae Th307]